MGNLSVVLNDFYDPQFNRNARYLAPVGNISFLSLYGNYNPVLVPRGIRLFSNEEQLKTSFLPEPSLIPFPVVTNLSIMAPILPGGALPDLEKQQERLLGNATAFFSSLPGMQLNFDQLLEGVRVREFWFHGISLSKQHLQTLLWGACPASKDNNISPSLQGDALVVFNCKGCNISDILCPYSAVIGEVSPRQCYPHALEEVILSGNQLQVFPDIPPSVTLRKLVLDYNLLFEIDLDVLINDYPNVTKFWCAYNLIRRVYSSSSGNSSLCGVHVNHALMHFSSVSLFYKFYKTMSTSVIEPFTFCRFPRLQKLELAGSGFKRISRNALFGLSSLTYLDVSNNLLSEMVDLEPLVQLEEYFCIGCHQMSCFGFCNATDNRPRVPLSLNKINLAGCNIKDIDVIFLRNIASKLTNLELHRNKFLGPELSKHSNLFSDMPNLCNLNLAEIGLSYLTPNLFSNSFYRCINGGTINLSKNPLKEANFSLAAKGSIVRAVVLSGCELTAVPSFPPDFFTHSNSASYRQGILLDLSYNNISRVPLDVCPAKALASSFQTDQNGFSIDVLDLSFNNISYVPVSVFYCPFFSVLLLASNALSHLPELSVRSAQGFDSAAKNYSGMNALDKVSRLWMLDVLENPIRGIDNTKLNFFMDRLPNLAILGLDTEQWPCGHFGTRNLERAEIGRQLLSLPRSSLNCSLGTNMTALLESKYSWGEDIGQLINKVLFLRCVKTHYLTYWLDVEHTPPKTALSGPEFVNPFAAAQRCRYLNSTDKKVSILTYDEAFRDGFRCQTSYCSQSELQCSSNAHIVTTESRKGYLFACKCNNGYHGDGFFCSEDCFYDVDCLGTTGVNETKNENTAWACTNVNSFKVGKCTLSSSPEHKDANENSNHLLVITLAVVGGYLVMTVGLFYLMRRKRDKENTQSMERPNLLSENVNVKKCLVQFKPEPSNFADICICYDPRDNADKSLKDVHEYLSAKELFWELCPVHQHHQNSNPSRIAYPTHATSYRRTEHDTEGYLNPFSQNYEGDSSSEKLFDPSQAIPGAYPDSYVYGYEYYYNYST